MDWFKSKKGVFSHSGPHHLTNIDWNDLQHRRTIMASLVRGVYLLERDRQKDIDGTNDALAPPWWEYFSFKLDDNGILENESSVFGAVFQFKHSPTLDTSGVSFSGLEKAPQYVVAFRGTMLRKQSVLRDLVLDAKILVHCLDRTSCFQTALNAVINLIKRCDSSKVWLTGHSLGSAIAMLVGKKMVCEEHAPLETYLFNSPFPSAQIDSIPVSEILKDLVHIGDGMLRVATAAVAGVCSSQRHPNTAYDRGMFDKLSQSGWKPYLFVNKADKICKGFISYFERREMMKKIGMENLEFVNAQISRVSLFVNKFSGRTTTPLHVLPSAVVVKSSFYKAHSLAQWYRRDVKCDPPKPYELQGKLEMIGSSVNSPPQLPSTD